MKETVVILDFGGQYKQLITRRVRERSVYSVMLPWDASINEIKVHNPVGIILSGGPNSVRDPDSPVLDLDIFKLSIPVLGICYGAQAMAHALGGKVESGGAREYGKRQIEYDTSDALFNGIPEEAVCWMSHGDHVSKLPEGFKIIAHTAMCPVAAYRGANNIYGVQFHPEVLHTEHGADIINNFLTRVCKARGDWTPANTLSELTEKVKEQVGQGHVLCALSGGVDSAVAAALINRVIGDRLHCVFVDHGLMRKNEVEEIRRVFIEEQKINLKIVDTSERFLSRLKGITDPEQKRKIIGEEFVRVFEVEAKNFEGIEFLAQGTIYADVIESGSKTAAAIKSHHNVGGLPEIMEFKGIVEPLRMLLKDEVRLLGKELGLPDHIVNRQPFPGPGLAIRIIGEITKDKLEILREADVLLREEIANAGLDKEIWQYFAVLTGNRTVGVMGDGRTYDYTLALRAVTSIDGMTADWARIPYDVLEKISTRIVNEVKQINRIVYDITSKPPSTIEWE